MYDVIFKIVMEPRIDREKIKRHRSHTLMKFYNKKLKGYDFIKHRYHNKWYTFKLVIDGMKINEYSIEEYYDIVNKFRSFIENEYNKILNYGHDVEVYGYMCIYDKEMYGKNKKEKWTIHDYYKNNGSMPNYNTILQHYCELKLYDPKNKTIRSYFDSYCDIYEEINNSGTPLNIADVCGNLYSSVYFGREEIINGYTPKYKQGDFVEYEGWISIIRYIPSSSPKYGDTYIDMTYQIDFIYDNKFYAWYCDRDIRDCDLKPYTGEVPEFMKLLQEAVLEKNGYRIVLGINDDLIDDLLHSRNVITEFNDFKDKLIALFKIRERGEWRECMM